MAFPQFTSAMTIAAWMRFQGSLDYGDVVVNSSVVGGGWSAFYLRIEGSSRYSFRIKTTSGQLCTITNPENQAVWRRVVGTYDRYGSGNNMKLYVDSVLVKSTLTLKEDIITQDNTVRIGKTTDANSLDVDDVCVANRAWTQAEVNTDYAGTPPSDGLIGRWSCDENTASKIVMDSSGNGLNGFATVNTDQLHIADGQEGTGAFRGTSEKYVQFSYVDQKILTVSSDDGGDVTDPGEGEFSYALGTVVALTATPDEGYQFAGWTGDTTNIADITAANTVITMSVNATIVATFEESDGEGDGVDESLPVPAQDQARYLKRIIALLSTTSGFAANKFVGGRSFNRLRDKVWQCKGVPSGAAPTGMIVGDLIVDLTNDAVYRYTAASTYVHITALI